MKKLQKISVFIFIFAMFLQAAPAASAKSPVLNDEIVAKIKKEAMENSQIMNTLHMLTDVYGPRLTGSPNLENAGKWSMTQMKKWGFDRTEMEPWDFGAPGWVNDRASGFIVSPVEDNLVFEVPAWTPSTNGIVTGSAVLMDIPTFKNGDDARCMRMPTEAELSAYLASFDGKLSGKMVLLRAPAELGVEFDPMPLRVPDEALKNPQSFRRQPGERPECPKLEVTPLTPREVNSRILDAINLAKPAVLISDARMRHGTIRAFGNRNSDPESSVPQVILRNEDYGRIWRLVKDGRDVKLQFYIKNTFYPAGKTAYNTIGEIAGTSKKDEVIMMGGHLDSWHSATGATDNAIGCAIMMEAGRILKAIGVKPKRTIRVALWAGEEQGLLGSQAYVEKHFGSAENPKPAFSKFGGYFNIDTGTGRVRQWGIFGPDSAAKDLGDAIDSYFADSGFAGVVATDSRRLGGSDHTSFDQAGLPGIGARQDPIEYFTYTWHTNLDTYERIVQDDVKLNAALVAASVYELAMRDELLPRFSADKMPKLP
ncbi:MAG: M20/M25/M40 family metallo-hydrolase [Pyrinomonadaceae bacterium]